MFDEERCEYGDLFTIEDFAEAVVCGAFIVGDGFGYYGTENTYSFDLGVWSVPASEAQNKGATHVHWFNK